MSYILVHMIYNNIYKHVRQFYTVRLIEMSLVIILDVYSGCWPKSFTVKNITSVIFFFFFFFFQRFGGTLPLFFFIFTVIEQTYNILYILLVEHHSCFFRLYMNKYILLSNTTKHRIVKLHFKTSFLISYYSIKATENLTIKQKYGMT
jgi:hypothetical protein